MRILSIFASAVLVSLLLGLSWVGIESVRNHCSARLCDSCAIGLTQTQAIAQFGMPNHKSGRITLIGAPQCLAAADDVWDYKFGDSIVLLGFNNGACIGSYSTIKVEPYDRVILWYLLAKGTIAPGPKGNSETQLSMEFTQPPWFEKGMQSGWGG